MAHVRDHREPDCLFFETLRGSGTANASAVFQTGMFGDGLFAPPGTAWKLFSDAFRKLANKVLIEFGTTLARVHCAVLSLRYRPDIRPQPGRVRFPAPTILVAHIDVGLC